jgi:IS30 family transposase
MAKRTAKVIHISQALRDRSYRWHDRDPDLEDICNLITDSGLSPIEISSRISRETGGAYTVANQTIYRWLAGEVRRPQNYTMTWVAFALGYERKWTKII